MKYAIIAAGEGSRLAQEGVAAPKPLVEVGGEPLLERLIRVFMGSGSTGVCVICNEQMHQVAAELERISRDGLDHRDARLSYLVKSTPSSMHSMWELSRWLRDEPFVLTTVDTIFRPEEFRAYVERFQRLLASGEADGLMGVTDYIDDEKPLYVGVDEQQRVTGFYDEPSGCRYISGGIYGLTPRSIDTLQRCIDRGESRMRNFQRALVADGLRLQAYPFSKVLDIDHASDIAKAEEFLRR